MKDTVDSDSKDNKRDGLSIDITNYKRNYKLYPLSDDLIWEPSLVNDLINSRQSKRRNKFLHYPDLENIIPLDDIEVMLNDICMN